MIVGAMQYGAWDPHFNFWGYVWAITNTLSTMCYNLYTKWAIGDMKMSASSSSLYNNVLCLPLFFVTASVKGEYGDIMKFLQEATIFAVFAVVLSGFIGFAMSYVGFRLQKLISATAFTVCVNTSKFMTVLVTWILFPKEQLSRNSQIGLAVSLGGVRCSSLTQRHASSCMRSLTLPFVCAVQAFMFAWVQQRTQEQTKQMDKKHQ